MSDVAVPSSYNEPTLMWRMRRGDRQESEAVIDPRGIGPRVVWFVNGHPLGLRDFDDWATAIRWTEQLRSHYEAAGWHASDAVEPGQQPQS
jgi:hypothetical protein